MYIDDRIIISKDKSVIDSFIYSLQHGQENYNLTDKREVDMYIGINTVRSNTNTNIELRQSFLIQRCLKVMEIDSSMNINNTPSTKSLLHKNTVGDPRKPTWYYIQVTYILNYLTGPTRPDLQFSTHQFARFSEDSKILHEITVRQTSKYFIEKKYRNIIFKSDKTKGLEYYVDVDFAGGWQNIDKDNPQNILSRTSYTIFYAGCPVIW